MSAHETGPHHMCPCHRPIAQAPLSTCRQPSRGYGGQPQAAIAQSSPPLMLASSTLQKRVESVHRTVSLSASCTQNALPEGVPRARAHRALCGRAYHAPSAPRCDRRQDGQGRRQDAAAGAGGAGREGGRAWTGATQTGASTPCGGQLGTLLGGLHHETVCQQRARLWGCCRGTGDICDRQFLASIAAPSHG